ncbi:transposase family protein [Micromonospora sp. NPDC048835]|uniref:transposase family protein n=1 Tax=Micromonospora sp. NPDC048835 TaxID=3155147 RepID=UPI0033E28803
MTHKNPVAEGSPLVYQSSLALSTKTLTLVVTAIRQHRSRVRSRWRKLSDHRAAVIVLAVLRHNQRPHDLAIGNGISASTVRRWVAQVIAVLATEMPRLSRVLRRARHHNEVVLLDGTLIPIQRPHDRHRRRTHYSGKHKTFGLLVLAITDLNGNLLWTSAALPARTAEITAARRNRIPAHLRAADLAAICDLGFTRLDDQPGISDAPRPRGAHPGHPHDQPTIITGRRAARGKPLTRHQTTVNALISRERATNEHAFSDLKNWRILDRLRGNHHHATTLIRALTVLTQTHTTR